MSRGSSFQVTLSKHGHCFEPHTTLTKKTYNLLQRPVHSSMCDPSLLSLPLCLSLSLPPFVSSSLSIHLAPARSQVWESNRSKKEKRTEIHEGLVVYYYWTFYGHEALFPYVTPLLLLNELHTVVFSMATACHQKHTYSMTSCPFSVRFLSFFFFVTFLSLPPSLSFCFQHPQQGLSEIKSQLDAHLKSSCTSTVSYFHPHNPLTPSKIEGIRLALSVSQQWFSLRIHSNRTKKYPCLVLLPNKGEGNNKGHVINVSRTHQQLLGKSCFWLSQEHCWVSFLEESL